MFGHIAEQIPLDLKDLEPSPDTAASEKSKLESMSISELKEIYTAKVGVHPRFTGQTEDEQRKNLIADIHNPQEALRKLHAIDLAEDQEDRRSRA